MAKLIITDASVVINAVDLSTRVDSVEVNMSSEMVDLTAMGAVSRTAAPGLRVDSMTFTFFQDKAAGSVDATLRALVGSAAGATIVVKDKSASVSSGNPSYSMTGVIDGDYMPTSAQVGTASKTTVKFVPADGSFIVVAIT